METAEYEVLAFRYGTTGPRKATENFLSADDHAGEPGALDYYVFAIRNAARTIVVDTGFDPESGQRRGRALLRTPVDALRQAGIEAATVQDVVITHLHWDHAGGMRYFPRATFHLQASEMAFATGPCMCHRLLRVPFDVEHVVDTVRALYADRIRFHDGVSELAPGIALRHLGGHSQGIQIVTVATAHGPLVLAGDTTHLWANLTERNPFPIVVDMPRVLDAYTVLESLASGPERIIPGHDPLILQRYPTLPGCTDVVRLDAGPG